MHLLFTTGHTAPAGADLVRRDLVERALDLARMLRALLPDDADVAGLLALILLTDARRETRIDADGRLLLLAEQDRTRWDAAEIAEGIDLVGRRCARRPPGRLRPAGRDRGRACAGRQLARTLTGAGSSSSTARSPSCGRHRWWRSTAPWRSGSPAGRRRVWRRWSRCPPSRSSPGTATCRRHGRRSCAELGRVAEARQAYEEAILLTENAVEREFLAGRLAELESSGR